MIEYFASNLWQLWALVALLCLILELTNGDFFIMCFAIGGVCSAIVSALGIGFVGGLVVFVICSVLCLIFVRPTALKYFHRSGETRVSNAEALIGRIGFVSQDIVEGGFGRVAVDGDDWKAVSADGQPIAKGTRVKIISMESIIVKVEKA